MVNETASEPGQSGFELREPNIRRPFGMEPPPTQEQIELVKAVWQECWADFQAWKKAFASNELEAAAIGTSTLPKIKVEDESGYAPVPPTNDLKDLSLKVEDDEDEDDCDTLHTLSIWQFNPTRVSPNGAVVHQVPVYEFDADLDTAEAVAPYESCVPLNTIVNITDTAAEFETLEFIPFANEVGFAKQIPDFLVDPETGEKRCTYKWEMPGRNPDGMSDTFQGEFSGMISSS